MPDTQELRDRLLAARPPDDDRFLESIVADRLFGRARATTATIDRFTLLERIGRGGTSDVFAAHDPVLDRTVALKLLRTNTSAHRLDADERDWLLREARAAARLAHPNVVTVYEVGELGDGREGIWVAMEHIDGVTLRAWLRHGRSRTAILDVLAQAGLGLAAAHDAGLVHGDLKPENVLVSGDEADVRGRVVDFGLARMVEHPSHDATEQRGVLMGTPAYMSPEQVLRRPVDARSDQFAFCVTLHEALTGRHPFGADRPGATAEEVLARVVAGERPLGERELPRWLRRIVARGLAADPAERHPSMHAVARALQATPARRRRRAGALAGAALVMGSSGLTLAWLDYASRSGCAGVEAELQGVWDPSRRAAALAAFSEADLADTEEVWRRLEPRIDDYARAWVASREQTCQGRLGGTALSLELATLRDACLDRRRAELDGLTELLVEAEAPTVYAALDAADRLTPIASCDDVESLRRESSLVEAPRGAIAIEVLRQEIARRTTQVRAGHGRELSATATALVARARRHGAPTPLAEALMLLGLVEDEQGDYDAEAASLETAVLEAVAARHDRLHAEIATRLVWTHGVRRRQTAAAEAWVARAEAAIRASRADPVLMARLLDHRGAIAQLAHDYPAAARLHREATETRRRISPRADIELASSIGNLGLAMLAQGRHEEAEPFIEDSLSRFHAAYGPSHPDVATMLAHLGAVYIEAGETERGISRLREALALKERIFGSDHVELLGTLTNLGNALGELGRDDEARALLRRGLVIGERAFGPEGPQLESLLYGSAFQSWVLGDHAAVVQEAGRTLALQRRLYGDDHPILALTYELLARGQLGQGDASAASEAIHRALALVEHGGLEPSARGSLLLSAAVIERAHGAPDDAVRTLASSARALLGDDPDPESARELAMLLDR